MDDFGNRERHRGEIYSESLKAGKRTYFFDVKSTKSDEYFITITESRKKFNEIEGKSYYEKHKIFLYNEDFEKFSEILGNVLKFIDQRNHQTQVPDNIPSPELSDITFEDLKEEQSPLQ